MPFPQFLIAVAAALFTATADAVILYRTDLVDENTDAPGMAFPHDGWDFEGSYGGFLGTPIGLRFFITAKHVSGGTGSVLVFQDALTLDTDSYTAIREYRDPTSDLVIMEVDKTFPYFAALYTREDEAGQRIVNIGRGTDRGAPIYYENDPMQLRGWSHGTASQTRRWGENIIASAFNYSPEWDLLVADFDQNGLPNECHLSGGDSGGAAFIEDGGVWKLAGINFAIDSGFFSQPDGTTGFGGAIFDLRGFYYASDGGFLQFDPNSPTPIPTAFYPTRISTKLPWIYSVIDPAGDYDSNGRPNLLDYALKINAPPPGAWSAPFVAVEGGFVALTYRKISGAPQLQYQIEKSFDLATWTAVTAQESVASTTEYVQTIEAKVPVGSSEGFFLRLLITQ